MVEKKDLRIVFMGTPEFAKASLQALVEAKYNVVGCFTNPDKPSGRGMKLQMSPVKEYCLENNISVYQPIKIRKNPEVLEILEKLNPDVICVTAYGKILPKEVLDYPKYGCINVHGSLLPKYRGAAPIQWSIINGDSTTGITTMYMDEGMDTGDMLLKAEVQIKDTDNFETVHDNLKVVGANLLVKTLDELVSGSLSRIKQPEGETFAPMIDKEMTKIDFNKSPRELFNFVRGLSPFPGTYMLDDEGRRYKVYEINFVENDNTIKNIENGAVFCIEKDKMSIKCNGGYINIVTIQPENSKKMNISDFLRGTKFKVGDKLK